MAHGHFLNSCTHLGLNYVLKITACCYLFTSISLAFTYRMVGNFGGNLFWRIAEISVFGGIYFGGLAKPVL